MRVVIRPSGLCIIRGMSKTSRELPAFVRRIRGSPNDYWSSWRWLSCLKQVYHLDKLPIEEGKENLPLFLSKRSAIIYRKEKQIFSDDEDAIFKRIFKFPLWDIQKVAASLMAYAERFYLADNVGLGKSLSAFAALVLLREIGLIERAVVLCTSSVKFQWQDEIKNALKEEYHSKYSTCVIHGVQQERMLRYQQDSFLYIVNYESLRADIIKNKASPFMFPFQAIVLDEAWKVRNRTTKLNRSLYDVIRNIRYRFALNATPIANRYEELFGVFNLLDPLIFISWKNFSDRYIKYRRVRLRNGRSFPKIDGYHRIPEIQQLTSATLLRRSAESVQDGIPEVLISSYWVDLTPTQRQQYDAIKTSDANPLAKLVAARVACLMDSPIQNSAKVQEFLSLVTEVLLDEKIIVFSESLTFLKEVLGILHRRKISAMLLSGEDDANRRSLIQEVFRTGKVRILLLTAAGEAGVNLQAANILVNLDIPWNPDRLRQRIGRLRPYLGGSKRRIQVLNIFARNTVEEYVIKVIQDKLGHFAKFFEEDVPDFTGTFNASHLATKI